MTTSRKVDSIRAYFAEHRDHKIGECSACDRDRFAEEITKRERDAREASDPKVKENRLRRAAERQGLKLEKARVRDERALDFGTYRLVDPHHSTVTRTTGPGDYGLTLADVERELNQRVDREPQGFGTFKLTR